MADDKKYLKNKRYLILRQLGEGATGNVYLADDTTKGAGENLCAVKELGPRAINLFSHREFTRRFKDEENYLRELDGFNGQIPKLIDYFSEESGGRETHYIVQEYVEGEKLSALAARGWLDEDRVKELLVKLLPVLAHVHDKGYVHRDINPTNIIVRRSDGRPVLIDYGAVKDLETTLASSADRQQDYSVVIGKDGYMAPEHLLGLPEAASDLYSLGVTAIVLLTGLNPISLVRDPVTHKLPWHEHAPDISAAFAAVLDRAVAPLAEERFEGKAHKMRDAIESIGVSEKEHLRRALGDAWTTLQARQPEPPAGAYKKCRDCDFYSSAGERHCPNCGAFNLRLLDADQQSLLRLPAAAEAKPVKGGVKYYRPARAAAADANDGAPTEEALSMGGTCGAIVGVVGGWVAADGFFGSLCSALGFGLLGALGGLLLGGLAALFMSLMAKRRRRLREEERLSEEQRLREQERRRDELEVWLRAAAKSRWDSGLCLKGVEAQIRMEEMDFRMQKKRIDDRLTFIRTAETEIIGPHELQRQERELRRILERGLAKQEKYGVKQAEIELLRLHNKLQVSTRRGRIDYEVGSALEKDLEDLRVLLDKILNGLKRADAMYSVAGKWWLARVVCAQETVVRSRRLLFSHLTRLISDESAPPPEELLRCLDLLNAYLTCEDFYKEYQALRTE